jgi:hypothetical protein
VQSGRRMVMRGFVYGQAYARASEAVLMSDKQREQACAALVV